MRFIVGGDMGIDEHARQLQSVAAAQDPQFALLGGDLDYSNGNWDHADRWDRWLNHWDSLMVTSTGDQIPIVSAIGNHEVRGATRAPSRTPVCFCVICHRVPTAFCTWAMALAGDRPHGWRG
ncbi:MAG: hypothetical protein VYB08_14380, partial [Candidatus Latescibacterota bacterium]|nr:hypothetical protein [Candidatus Latescibacterota bacterium]